MSKVSYTFEQYIKSCHFSSESVLEQYLQRCERRGWQPTIILNTWIRWDENKNILVTWLKENCKNKWDYRHACFWEFEDEQDAMLFRLTWGDRIDRCDI